MSATDTVTPTTPERSAPNQGEVVDEIPSSSRQGFWATEFEWFKANPNKVKRYTGISPTTASYLRSTYGLDAHSRNTRDKRCDLYVTFNPDNAEAIKNRPKRTRKPKAEGAVSGGSAPAAAGAKAGK